MFIAHRQRFATLALPVIPPTFEVHGPHVIGSVSSANAPEPTGLRGSLATSARFGQAGSLQDSLETALGSGLTVRPPIQFPNLARSPVWVGLFEAHDLADDGFGQFVGQVFGSARLLGHARQTVLQQPLLPLVAGLGADPIFGAQGPKVLCAQRLHRKLHPLIHRSILFPRHPAAYPLQAPRLSVTYVLNLMCYRCSEPAPVPTPISRI